MDSTSSEEVDEAPPDLSQARAARASQDATDRIVEAIRQSAVFQGLDDTILTQVLSPQPGGSCDGCMFVQMASMMTREVHYDEDVIIRQGDMPNERDRMYYVAGGEVHLHISGTQSEKQQIIPKKAGWVFGELALLFSSPRTASVIASGICILYSLSRRDFVHLAKYVPKIRMLRFLRKLPFLKSVNDPKLIEFGNQTQLKTYCKEESMTLDENMFYMIRSGKVQVKEASMRHGSHILNRGNFFEVDKQSMYRAMTDVELIIVDATIYHQLDGSERYLLVVEKSLKQILEAVGSINVQKIDIAETVRRTPLISASNQDAILELGQCIEHLYVVVKGEVCIHHERNDDQPASSFIKYHNGLQFFGDKWNQKLVSDVNVLVSSERVQLVRVPHQVLADAGWKDAKKEIINKGPHLASRVVDAEPLSYEGPQIRFQDLRQHRVVGEGEYGSVRLVTHKLSGNQYALKIMHKAAIKDTKTAEHVIMERKMLIKLDGKSFLVGFRGGYQDEKSIYLLMDWVPGGELFSRIIDCGGRLPESHAVFYAANVVLAYSQMHELNIIYRDLKPENMLIDKNGYLKLADYGFATIADGSAWTVCGTPDYQAPEIISRQGASKASDFWALGVLIYEMLTGDAPFKSPTDDRWDTHRRILSGRFYIPEYVSKPAADLITHLLQVDPSKRLGHREDDLESIRAHPWFKKIDWNRISHQKMSAPFIPKLVNSMDTSCFDFYDSPKKSERPQHNFFDKHRPWSNLWSWIEEF